MENKKVVNAKKYSYDNIQFDSKLEVNCYELLKINNIPFEYNKNTYTLLPSFRLNRVNYICLKGKKSRTFTQVINKKGEKEMIKSMTLTPDFKILNNKYLIFIETKGYANDVYPYKRRLFFNLLENNYKEYDKIYYFEPRNIKHVEESIEKIKELLDEENRENRTSS